MRQNNVGTQKVVNIRNCMAKKRETFETIRAERLLKDKRDIETSTMQTTHWQTLATSRSHDDICRRGAAIDQSCTRTGAVSSRVVVDGKLRWELRSHVEVEEFSNGRKRAVASEIKTCFELFLAAEAAETHVWQSFGSCLVLVHLGDVCCRRLR